jgi:hypothetical protein
MNKEQQELLDEVYKNYKRLTHKINEKNHYGEYSKWGDAPLISGVQHLTKDSFIQMIKINSEFSEKWGLKIEERELNVDELNIVNLLKQTSTKLITLEYNGIKTESYE